MPSTVTFNDTEDLVVSRVTLTGSVRINDGRVAGANGLMPTVFEVEREMDLNPSAEFYSAAVASPDSANEATLEYDMEVRGGTAYSVSVAEGTVVAWRLCQEDPDASVIETTTLFARKAEIDREGTTADLTLVTSR